MRTIFITFLILVTLSRTASAHEYWIDPVAFLLEPGQSVKADLRVGQDFKGSRLPFLSNQFQSFEITDASGTRPLPGTEGDRPAVNVAAPEGLVVLAYHSKSARLTFRDFDQFRGYVEYEGLGWAVQAHKDAGLPDGGFTERYTRNAKSLLQVGDDVTGQDFATGLPFELVVIGSPYGTDNHAVTVELLWQGQPVPDWRINVFTRGGAPEATLTHVTTGSNGRATIPFPDQTDILLNAVWLQRPTDGSGYAWESWWASLTFGHHGRHD